MDGIAALLRNLSLWNLVRSSILHGDDDDRHGYEPLRPGIDDEAQPFKPIGAKQRLRVRLAEQDPRGRRTSIHGEPSFPYLPASCAAVGEADPFLSNRPHAQLAEHIPWNHGEERSRVDQKAQADFLRSSARVVDRAVDVRNAHGKCYYTTHQTRPRGGSGGRAEGGQCWQEPVPSEPGTDSMHIILELSSIG